MTGFRPLWHGPPLANVASRMLRRDAAPALERERLRAPERVGDLELAAGNCHQVLADPYESARRHPVRERFTERLVEALHRTGRQAEAPGRLFRILPQARVVVWRRASQGGGAPAYWTYLGAPATRRGAVPDDTGQARSGRDGPAENRTVRDRLRAELGVDPGAGLRRPEPAILRSEEIGRPEAAGARPALPRAGAVGRPSSDSGRRGVPRARPERPGLSPVPGFAGRATDRAAIAARLTSAEGPRLAVVSGRPASGGRRRPTSARTRSGPSSQAGLHPRRAAPGPGDGGRRLLVLDDTAGVAGRVLPLLSAAEDASVLVTGRRGLSAVVAAKGGSVHRLDVLRPAEAYALLADRIAAEADAAAELAGSADTFRRRRPRPGGRRTGHRAHGAPGVRALRTAASARLGSPR
ncbi:BTAD domain-containing putative transcriptional regulator [Streptomyces sp. NPDC057686]|uniref:BTAD domain-containing putative transcriptional regulator n=1 Tax=Streptomyces sp. NPDC057686 TaxID=3346212 RepID=UPI0036B5205C